MSIPVVTAKAVDDETRAAIAAFDASKIKRASKPALARVDTKLGKMTQGFAFDSLKDRCNWKRHNHGQA